MSCLQNENAAYAELFRLNGANSGAGGVGSTFKGAGDCARIAADEPSAMLPQINYSQHSQDVGQPAQSPLGILEMPPSREIVTVKTLLTANQQESCV